MSMFFMIHELHEFLLLTTEGTERDRLYGKGVKSER